MNKFGISIVINSSLLSLKECITTTTDPLGADTYEGFPIYKPKVLVQDIF